MYQLEIFILKTKRICPAYELNENKAINKDVYIENQID